jgi:hypothetical protein
MVKGQRPPLSSYRESTMNTRRSHALEGELAVLISVVVSLGMVALSLIGWFLWNAAVLIIESMSAMNPSDLP